MLVETRPSKITFSPRGTRAALITLEYDACGECGVEHADDCEYLAALALLPASASMGNHVFDAQSREIQLWQW